MITWVREMITQKELLRHKGRIDFLSKNTKESHESLVGLCNEINFAKNVDSVEDSSSKADNLIYILSQNMMDHLASIQSLLSAYKEYSELLETSISQSITREKRD